jgi:Bacteriophage tail sheath protein
MPTYSWPGIYIEEVTGPGVIAGVGTSTAGFIGPAGSGPMLQPTRITSFDDYLRQFGTTRGGRQWPYLYTGTIPYYLGFAVEGFFRNGGTEAFIVRIGTAARASLTVNSQAGEPAFTVEALQDGITGNGINVTVEPAATVSVATGAAKVTKVTNQQVTVEASDAFRVGDVVTAGKGDPATITRIQGQTLIVATPLDAAPDDTLRIADLAQGRSDAFRVTDTAGLSAGDHVLIDATDPAIVAEVDSQTMFVKLEGALAKDYALAPNPPTLTQTRLLVVADANITDAKAQRNPAGQDVTVLTLDDTSKFVPGDTVTGGAGTGVIDNIQGNEVWLRGELLGSVAGGSLRLADVGPLSATFRVDRINGLTAGSLLKISSTAGDDYVEVAAASPSNIVTIASKPVLTHTHTLTDANNPPTATAQEFRLVVAPAAAATATERIEPLSLNPVHPRFVLNADAVNSEWIEVSPPTATPPLAESPDGLLAVLSSGSLSGGQDDQPNALTAGSYQDGLDALRDIDDVNLLAIPDAAAHRERQSIQQAAIDHCLAHGNRFAILDSVQGAPPFGAGSVQEQRAQVSAERGFAGLYYPWLVARDPTAPGTAPRTMNIPPSGHLAGIYARTDQERGVHKAPANTEVRGALGIERPLTDQIQGPLNLAGVDLLRVFPGNASVIVWGARTTVDPDITDWIYINVRRLLNYIEASIQEGIRWAVFEPNDLSLWRKLDRTIGDFLTRVWRDGGLFGAKASDAFQVRIDETLNPPSTRALGQLFIEILVAPVRPAEFIVVRIGLWDGGGTVSEA